jgi:Bacterial Ig-like domain (group 3)
MEVKPIMPSSRLIPWHAAGVCMVPVAVVAASLLIGGVANSAPPGDTPQAADALAAATTTTTMLTASPVSPVAQNTPVTLTATISPATAVGTVQFIDGTTNVGDLMQVTNGIARRSISTLGPGSHSLTAVFTPANAAAFSTSTSPAVTIVVNAPAGATATNTTLTTSPAATVAQGYPMALTATVTPATAVGTVQFRDGTTNFGNSVVVSNGIASGSASTLGPGTHTLTAVFTPTDPAAFNPSMSSEVPLTVTDSGAGSVQAIISQQSGLSLDVRLSVLGGDQAAALDGGPTVLDVSMPLLDGRTPVHDGALSVLGDRGLLGGGLTVVLGLR